MLDSKCKMCRRAGEKLFLKGERCFTPKCAISRNPGLPGMHRSSKGSSKSKRGGRGGSEFGKQLAEKQKVKRSYGLREKQFRKYFDAASKKHAATSDVLAQLLEARLDNVIYRLGFAGSRSQARQTAGHGHFIVNGRRVDIPSFQLKIGDVVAIRSGSASKVAFKDLKTALKKYQPPEWLELDKDNLVGKVKRLPTLQEIDMPFKLQLITEFYSR